MIDFICNDVMDELKDYPENMFDGCLCDPPYGLKFMGKEWDHGVPSKETWREVLRVLKPGAMLMAFGGTRTHHRLMCAIEDAGFEIRDCMMYLYGSGFPKSLDISKAIDKNSGAEREVIGVGVSGRTAIWNKEGSMGDFDITAPATDAARHWSGYGTALKPAWEPIILAMKPCEGTFAENALKWGVAGLGIDRSRLSTGDRLQGSRNPSANTGVIYGVDKGGTYKQHNDGRWPANLLLDDDSAGMLDEQSGELGRSAGGGRNVGGLSNTHHKRATQDRGQTIGFGDSGGASRFFYCAKASKSERGEGNNHPTVKPLKLCEYLARLILPPVSSAPRSLLVPFSGSGSEAIAADRAGWEWVLAIEIEPSYVEIAKRRGSQMEPEKC